MIQFLRWLFEKPYDHDPFKQMFTLFISTWVFVWMMIRILLWIWTP